MHCNAMQCNAMQSNNQTVVSLNQCHGGTRFLAAGTCKPMQLLLFGVPKIDRPPVGIEPALLQKMNEWMDQPALFESRLHTCDASTVACIAAVPPSPLLLLWMSHHQCLVCFVFVFVSLVAVSYPAHHHTVRSTGANASLDPICFIETPEGKVYVTKTKGENS